MIGPWSKLPTVLSPFLETFQCRKIPFFKTYQLLGLILNNRVKFYSLWYAAATVFKLVVF